MNINGFQNLTVARPDKIIGIEVIFKSTATDIANALETVEIVVNSNVTERDLVGIFKLAYSPKVKGAGIVLNNTIDSYSFNKLLTDLKNLSSTETVECTINLKVDSTTTDSVFLSWNDAYKDEDGYKIERSIDGCIFTQIGLVSPNVANYVDSELIQATVYYYRVRGYRGIRNYVYSNVAGALTQTASGIVQNLTFESLDLSTTEGIGDGVDRIINPFGMSNVEILANPISNSIWSDPWNPPAEVPIPSPMVNVSIINTDKYTGTKSLEIKTLVEKITEAGGGGLLFSSKALMGTDKKHAVIEFAIKPADTLYDNGYYETVRINLPNGISEDWSLVPDYQDTANNDGLHTGTNVAEDGTEIGSAWITGRLINSGAWNTVKITIDENEDGTGNMYFIINGTSIRQYKRAVNPLNEMLVRVTLQGHIPVNARLLIDDFKVTLS